MKLNLLFFKNLFKKHSEIDYKKLAISLGFPQLAGIFGSFFTASTVNTWYQMLEKPSFNPPSWVFGPVWITLYFLMGISVYLAWTKCAKEECNLRNVRLFWIHLLFNACWSLLFFGLRNPWMAFVCIIAIWIFIISLIFQFFRIDKRASFLLIPYFLWVSFAAVLNYYIWYLNY